MKRCPECRRDYYDDTLLYCLDDGNALLEGPASGRSEPPSSVGGQFDEPQTAILHERFPRADVAAAVALTSDSKLDAPKNSIAVLPFANISNDADNEYFCDGLAEELLNALAKIGELKVAARTSAFSFRGKNVQAREIGRALNVDTVLEGSVRKAGNRIRINVQLVNAADGYQLWSDRYDREMRDIFDIQDEITLAVVDALKLKLIGEQKAAVLKHHTRHSEALEFYLRGASYFSKFTPEFFRKAIECFERAIAIDPAYAEAYAGVAECYSEMSFFTAPAEWMPKAKEAARRAVALDDLLGRAHNSLAVTMMYYDRDYVGAEAEFKRAINLDPRSAHIIMWYGWFLGLSRRFDEGLLQMKKARELDPLSPLISFGIGSISLWARHLDRSIDEFNALIEMHPDFPLGYQYLATAYLTKGDISSAVAITDKAPITPADPFSMTSAACVYARAGNLEKALEFLDEIERLSAGEFELSVQIAQVYVALNEKEKAFNWLKKAFAQQSVWPNWLAVDPIFDALRDDLRFKELIKRMNLPE